MHFPATDGDGTNRVVSESRTGMDQGVEVRGFVVAKLVYGPDDIACYCAEHSLYRLVMKSSMIP